jgi:hypothetical protein
MQNAQKKNARISDDENVSHIKFSYIALLKEREQRKGCNDHFKALLIQEANCLEWRAEAPVAS